MTTRRNLAITAASAAALASATRSAQAQTAPAGVQLGWRYMSYDQRGDALVQDMTMSGAYLAVNFSL
jgi:hypothetical protein